MYTAALPTTTSGFRSPLHLWVVQIYNGVTKNLLLYISTAPKLSLFGFWAFAALTWCRRADWTLPTNIWRADLFSLPDAPLCKPARSSIASVLRSRQGIWRRAPDESGWARLPVRGWVSHAASVQTQSCLSSGVLLNDTATVLAVRGRSAGGYGVSQRHRATVRLGLEF
jgi:hypothetical protein